MRNIHPQRLKRTIPLIRSQQETEDFRRPDHPDFATSAELAKNKFSGLRHNSVTSEYEIWITGEICERVSMNAIAMNSMALSDAYSKVFKL